MDHAAKDAARIWRALVHPKSMPVLPWRKGGTPGRLVKMKQRANFFVRFAVFDALARQLTELVYAAQFFLWRGDLARANTTMDFVEQNMRFSNGMLYLRGHGGGARVVYRAGR